MEEVFLNFHLCDVSIQVYHLFHVPEDLLTLLILDCMKHNILQAKAQ